MIASVLEADGPALRVHPDGVRRRTPSRPAWSVALLFGLSLAVALPPATWLPPLHPFLPEIDRTQTPVLDSAELGMVLGQPADEVGRGRIALGDVDRRLCGLTLDLDVLRVGAARGRLVTIGAVGFDRVTVGGDGATPADLWGLAREAIPQYGIARNCRLRTAIDSVVVFYGGATAQVAWLAADHLATVSVTDLDASEDRPTDLAYTLTRLLVHRLADRVGRG